MRGIEVFSGALSRVRAHEIELAERERKLRQQQPNATPPKPRRR